MSIAAGIVMPWGIQQFHDDNGDPVALGSVYFYQPGTTTTQVVYKDTAGASAWTQPVSLDAAGRPDSAPIVLDASLGYKVVLKSAAGATIKTVDSFYLPKPPQYTQAAMSGTGQGLRITGPSPVIEWLDNSATQNWHAGINDSVSDSFVIGRGWGPGQALAPSLTIGKTSLAVTIGETAAATPNAVFNVVASDTYGNSDWVAWFRRHGAAPVSCHVRFQHFSGTVQPEVVLAGLVARGTLASPTAVLSGDNLMIVDGRGYDASAVNHGEYAVGWSDGQASLIMSASENWTGTAHGSAIGLYTTPNGSVTQALRLKITQSGGVAIGDSTDPGATNLRVTGFIETIEQTDPSAPAANTARLYAKDNGAGKTLLVVRFPTGAVQTIATEP